MTSLSSNQSNQPFLHNYRSPSVCLDIPFCFLRFHTCVKSPFNFFQVPYLRKNLPPPSPRAWIGRGEQREKELSERARAPKRRSNGRGDTPPFPPWCGRSHIVPRISFLTLVLPSLNTIRVPGRIYSGSLINLNVTRSLSPVRNTSCK